MVLSLLCATLTSACAVEAPGDEAMPQEVAETGELLCTNPGGVNSVMTGLAVAAGQQLRRWNAPLDFRWNSSSGMLELTAAGKSRCYDGHCKNVQAVLDMQKWEAHNNATFPGNIKLDVGALRRTLKSSFERQVRCNNYWGEFSTNGCWVENHDLWYDHAEPGSCDTKFFFWRNKAGTNQGLNNPERLQHQLHFAGYPENRMLNFYQRDWQVSVDPTAGLTEGGLTTTGSCSAACTKYSSTSLIGQCCSCNGMNKTYVRSSFSYNYYQCK